jgi:hypothetical protein
MGNREESVADTVYLTICKLDSGFIEFLTLNEHYQVIKFPTFFSKESCKEFLEIVELMLPIDDEGNEIICFDYEIVLQLF